MVDTTFITLEPRLKEILEARSVRGNISYWSNPIVKRDLREKPNSIALNTTTRDYTTTFGLREAIYRANK